MAGNIVQLLKEVGSKLETPPASKDALIKLLKQAANCLSEIEQSPEPTVLNSVQPCLRAVAKPELLKHQDKDVKVLLATCICEITRITAPEAPYEDDVLRDFFHLIVGTFSGLADLDSPSFGRRVVILETLARYRSCIVMLDIDCDDLINEMFSTFLGVISDDHQQNVLTSMQTIMILILEESEDIQENLLITILSVLGRKRNGFSMAARKLAMNVLQHCAAKIKSYVEKLIVSSLTSDSSCTNNSVDHHEVIYDIYQCAPQILTGTIPYITGELLTDKLDTRLKAVQLLGELFALPETPISEVFQPLFPEFLKRLTDRVVEIRIAVIDHLKNCLISNPSRPEASHIIEELSDRLLDYDENVRKQVVSAVYDVACHSLEVIPAEVVRLVAERLRDKSLSVKKYTLERLADLYRLYCSKSSGDLINKDEYKWIPGKILRCLYDRDFRSETIELVLCLSLFPPESAVKDKVEHWITIFSGFDKIERKALEQILSQKQRLQQEMQKYLSLRQGLQEDVTELQKRIFTYFRNMARVFNDPVKAEENFHFLNQLKDVNIWKILSALLDPSTTLSQAQTSRDELLKILGEKHPIYDFMGMLSLKCSYLLFNKEYAKEILSAVSLEHSAGNTDVISSCMKLLTVIASYSPFLLVGCEEEFVRLLKEDDELIKEGITHVLAKAGGTIREQLAMVSSSVELLLERLCLEGTRRQAKYSVQALVAITKDDGLKSLSVLYKRLVDMLEEKTHLPAILQTLGCIAQSAMPIFETREEEVVLFIRNKILDNSDKADEVSLQKTEWNEPSELCLLKIYGIKTLVKSYLPANDAHLRPGIEKLVGILKNFLLFGDVSNDKKSSAVDKAHLRIASAKAVLRLSRHWDQKIPVDVFYLTLKFSEDAYPESRKLFLGKLHQYIKERLVDAKYACAFLFNIKDGNSSEYEECKQHLLELVHICQQVKIRQLSMQSDMNPALAYPEYILAYVVHALAHHPSCPDVEESMDVQAFEPTFWRLQLFLSLILNQDETLQSSFPNRRKESYASLLSIFNCIRLSQDVVDGSKTRTLHAISDLGLSLLKKMASDLSDLPVIDEVPLPSMLYSPPDKSQEGLLEYVETWLSSESALAHFEALSIQTKEKVDPETIENGTLLEERDADGNEVPLGKMMEILRSQGSKKKKKKKPMKQPDLPSDSTKLDNDVDLLSMVREINMDNLEKREGNELSKLMKDDVNLGSGKTVLQNNGKKILSPLKRNSNGSSIEIIMSSPKRKRSISVHRSPSAKVQTESKKVPFTYSFTKENMARAPFKKKLSSQMEKNDAASPVSSSEKSKGIFSKIGKKDADDLHLEKTLESPPILKSKKSDLSKSLSSSTKKRKVRSIAGLEKCSSQLDQLTETDIVGSRIKVWWPLDKQFYEGVIQSYDSAKKKHAVLYDDGDVEVLNLKKEKWELASDSFTPEKAKSSTPSNRKDLSQFSINSKSNHSKSGQNSKPRKKSLASKSGTKGSAKRRSNGSNKRISENQINADLSHPENGNNSDLSDAGHHSDSEIEDNNLGSGEEMEAGLKDSNESMEEDEPNNSAFVNTDSDDEPLNAWRLKAAKT